MYVLLTCLFNKINGEMQMCEQSKKMNMIEWLKNVAIEQLMPSKNVIWTYRHYMYIYIHRYT